MARQEQVIAAFNRGRVSRFALSRTEVKRIALSAEVQTNYVPRVLGSMSLRPGLQYIGATYGNAAAKYIPFVYSTTDKALLEFTDSLMRVWVSDALVTRASVTSVVPALSTWTDADEGSAVSTAGATLIFVGDGAGAARRYTAVATANAGTVHALRIVVSLSSVTLRIGTSSTDDSYVNETTLRTGTHSIAFTPAGTYYITLMSRNIPVSQVSSCVTEAAGTLTLPTPYTSGYLSLIRNDQSGDIVFIACNGLQQRMIERRANNSWSVVLYTPNDGPFKSINTGPITIAASALTGDVTLTASNALFKSTQVGGLYQLTSEGQSTSRSITAQNTFAPATGEFVVTGVGTDRTFTITISGLTGTGSTVTLQRSVGVVGSWSDVPLSSWTADTVSTYADELDNQTVYYQIGVKTGGYAGGTIVCSLSISTGSVTGVVRVSAFSSSTSVTAKVLSALGGTAATDLWKEGEWSDKNGWPSVVSLHEGRMWWAGKTKIWGSISDAYDSFNPDLEGDSGVISRSIGAGPVDQINWMASNQRLLIGAQGTEFSARASTLDEPLSPSAFVVKPASNQGSAAIDAVKVDNRCIFVQRNGSKIYELAFDTRWYDYAAHDLTTIIPEIGYPGIVRIAMQRQQDTRIHCVRSDGTVALFVQDKTEDMQAWIDIETDGDVEDVVVLPGESGSLDDDVYYVVKRTINAATVRYLEKWAQQIDCEGGTVNKQADAFIVVTNAPASVTVSGLSHLEGEEVAVWADGEDVGTDTDYTYLYTVSGGAITLATAAASIVVGLPYTAQFKSMKLGSATQSIATSLNHNKNINHVGLVLADTHPKGIRYGPEFTFMDSMPNMEAEKIVDQNTIHTAYDEHPIEFPGIWNTDSRLCLQSQAPRPCTVLSAVIQMELT